MGITESLWLIIYVYFILSLISTLIFLTLIEKYTITLYEKCRNGRVLTPFKAEGYTGETKFRVLKNRGSLKRGDIVTVAYDDGKTRIYFKKEDGRLGWFWLPNMTPEGYEEDLEVYEEVYEGPTKKLTPFEKAGYTRNTQFRVLRDYWNFKQGDVVTLHIDDGTLAPCFKTEDDRRGCMWIPNTVDVVECEELEVYEEPKGGF